MIWLIGSKGMPGMVFDQKGSPAWTHNLAVAIKKIIDTGNDAYGTYHFSGEGETNWYGFAKEIQRR